MLYMENTEQQGTGIENGSERPGKWNGPFRSDRSNHVQLFLLRPCYVVPSTPGGMYTVLAVDKQN